MKFKQLLPKRSESLHDQRRLHAVCYRHIEHLEDVFHPKTMHADTYTCNAKGSASLTRRLAQFRGTVDLPKNIPDLQTEAKLAGLDGCHSAAVSSSDVLLQVKPKPSVSIFHRRDDVGLLTGVAKGTR